MKTWLLFKSLGPVDLKSVTRDALLLLLTVGSLLLALLIRLATPALTRFLQIQFHFDLVPLYPLVMSLVLLLAPGMTGIIVGFLLLDERDQHTLTALLVTPISLPAYLFYRISVPILLAFVVTLMAVPLAGLVAVPFLSLLMATALASVGGAITALFLVAFAENKVTGLAVMKFMQGMSALPMAAYFVDPPWQWVAGIMPTYWSLKVYWLAAAGEGYQGYLLVGIGVNLLVLGLLLRRYNRTMHR